MTNDPGDHIIASLVNMQLYHSRPKVCPFQCNFDNTEPNYCNDHYHTILSLSPKSMFFSICDILQANFKYKYKGGCAISTEPPTKVEWCFAKSALKVPTKSLRIFLSEFQWTPTDRDHQSITQSRLGG